MWEDSRDIKSAKLRRKHLCNQPEFASARATLYKLATCTRHTFLLAKQAETINIVNKRSKTDFGYD